MSLLPPSLTSPILLLSSVFLVLFPFTSCAVLPYTTLGPGIVSPGGIGALTAGYPLGQVPYNSSYPTLSFALTLTLDSSVPLDPTVSFLQFLVDLTNFRGGVTYQHQPHYISITYTTDDNSNALARIAYEELFASNNFSMFFAPTTDSLLQAINPLLPKYDVTIMSMDNQDPLDYSAHYPNMFTIVNTADQAWVAALDEINSVAQSYHLETGLGSPHGISTLCLYTAQETLLQAAAAGVRAWVTAENGRRGGVDNITMAVDMSWSNDATDTYLDYVGPLLQCPDNTDVMLMMADSDSELQVTAALASSQRRPKAALGANPVTQFVINNVTELLELSGWVAVIPISFGDCTLGPLGGVVYSLTDVATARYIWKLGSGLVNFTDSGQARPTHPRHLRTEHTHIGPTHTTALAHTESAESSASTQPQSLHSFADVDSPSG